MLVGDCGAARPSMLTKKCCFSTHGSPGPTLKGARVNNALTFQFNFDEGGSRFGVVFVALGR